MLLNSLLGLNFGFLSQTKIMYPSWWLSIMTHIYDPVTLESWGEDQIQSYISQFRDFLRLGLKAVDVAQC